MRPLLRTVRGRRAALPRGGGAAGVSGLHHEWQMGGGRAAAIAPPSHPTPPHPPRAPSGGNWRPPSQPGVAECLPQRPLRWGSGAATRRPGGTGPEIRQGGDRGRHVPTARPGGQSYYEIVGRRQTGGAGEWRGGCPRSARPPFRDSWSNDRRGTRTSWCATLQCAPCRCRAQGIAGKGCQAVGVDAQARCQGGHRHARVCLAHADGACPPLSESGMHATLGQWICGPRPVLSQNYLTFTIPCNCVGAGKENNSVAHDVVPISHMWINIIFIHKFSVFSAAAIKPSAGGSWGADRHSPPSRRHRGRAPSTPTAARPAPDGGERSRVAPFMLPGLYAFPPPS